MPERTRTAIVTGGASGIGYAFAEALAGAGCNVVIADLNRAEESAAQLRSAGRAAIGVRTDVTSEADAAAMVQAAIDRFGSLDVLVNNAGLFTTLKLKPFDQIGNDEWRRVMEVNTLGPFQLRQGGNRRTQGERLGSDRQHRFDGADQGHAEHAALHLEQGRGDRIHALAGARSSAGRA